MNLSCAASPNTPTPRAAQHPTANSTPEIDAMLARDCVVAVSISGGRDSTACLLAVHEHLENVGHTGPRIAIHSDLGRVEWRQSLPKCQEVADHLGWELLVVNRAAGDMMDRWLVRWTNNVNRYQNLETVKLILPWSTPSMRFCTSELKTSIINSALRKRFPGLDVVNVTGIRRQESNNRAKMPVVKANPNCVKQGGTGVTWNAVIEWDKADVGKIIARHGLSEHEGYIMYQMERISCVACIMASEHDLYSATMCPDNVPIYIEMVELEARSSFSFQGNRWLGDINPSVQPDWLIEASARAKVVAALREQAEARIPARLLFTKGTGYPACIPTLDEAQIMAEVRSEVGQMLELKMEFTSAETIVNRYTELMDERIAKDKAKGLIPVLDLGRSMGSQVALF
ncbi:phosphoadenosine phosphosulfate reductase family protein (plasmid) [Halopseudomonas sp. SMJS2]|uniref:phosphoadenosine phosphosulfate reductase family protein n=1 Tax=Halopseudomonas sp. SMJS2 TaxID=3041098 RepID=UPI002452A93C|nr:phosphoadenosine phosphosulfate reductase family protein [Halopseudomonas sp. SMJS2]WGK63467.1 phosphoadenosine phosphosulfate reductase family protein [Halopseudomonas sp. SMJS2]